VRSGWSRGGNGEREGGRKRGKERTNRFQFGEDICELRFTEPFHLAVDEVDVVGDVGESVLVDERDVRLSEPALRVGRTERKARRVSSGFLLFGRGDESHTKARTRSETYHHLSSDMLTSSSIGHDPHVLSQCTQHRVDKVVQEPDHLVQEIRRFSFSPPRERHPVDLGELEEVVQFGGDDGGDLVLGEREGLGEGRKGEKSNGSSSLSRAKRSGKKRGTRQFESWKVKRRGNG